MKNFYLLLLIVSLSVSGCVPQSPPSRTLLQQQRALALIDEGTYLLRNLELNKAKASFQMAYELGKSSAALDGLGSVSFLQGDLYRARDYFLAAYQSDTKYGVSLSHLALLYDFWEFEGMTSQESSRVNGLYARSLRMNPEDWQARNNRAAYLFDQKGYRQAERELLLAESVSASEIVDRNLQATRKMIGNR